MCGFDSEENSSEEEEEEDEDSSILTTVKTSSKFYMKWQKEAINSVIEEAILEVEDEDVKLLSLGLLNQEKGLNGNGSSFSVAVVLNSIAKGTTQVAFLGILSKAIVLGLCQSDIKVLGTMSEDEYKKLKEKLSKDQQKPLHLFALRYLPDKSLAQYSSISD